MIFFNIWGYPLSHRALRTPYAGSFTFYFTFLFRWLSTYRPLASQHLLFFPLYFALFQSLMQPHMGQSSSSQQSWFCFLLSFYCCPNMTTFRDVLPNVHLVTATPRDEGVLRPMVEKAKVKTIPSITPKPTHLLCSLRSSWTYTSC